MVITARETKVKSGYKLTEVGVIPEDWEMKRLGEIADLTSSKRIFEHEYVPYGIPFYRGKEISQLINGEQIADSYFILESRYNQIRSEFGVPKQGDILITAVGTLGNVYVIPDDKKFYFKDGNLIWLKSIKNAHPGYIAVQIRRKKTEIISNAIGSSQKALTIVVLKGVLIPYPSLPEQTAIATALSDVDALLASLDKLIAKKRDIKQATMQQLLTGKTRLPGFSGDWEVKNLGDVVEMILGGGTPSRSRPEYWGGNIPWVTVKDFATFDPYSTQENITMIGLQNSASRLIKRGTIIISTRMALGKASIYKVDVSINQDLKAIYLKKNISSIFVLYWFEHNAKNIEDLGGGSTVKGISLSDLKNISFLKPPTLEEQQSIAAVLSDMDAEIAALEQKRDKTRALKQGMMQELLTGRIRLL